jgi:hypothetical protein
MGPPDQPADLSEDDPPGSLTGMYVSLGVVVLIVVLVLLLF